MSGDVRTWANGHGSWHAMFPSSGNRRRDAYTARRAIGHELALREGASAAMHYSVTRVDDGSGNARGYVIYAER